MTLLCQSSLSTFPVRRPATLLIASTARTPPRRCDIGVLRRVLVPLRAMSSPGGMVPPVAYLVVSVIGRSAPCEISETYIVLVVVEVTGNLSPPGRSDERFEQEPVDGLGPAVPVSGDCHAPPSTIVYIVCYNLAPSSVAASVYVCLTGDGPLVTDGVSAVCSRNVYSSHAGNSTVRSRHG